MNENENKEVQPEQNDNLKLEALQEQLNTLQKDLSSRDKKIAELSNEVKLSKAEAESTKATAKEIATVEITSDYEQRIKSLEMQNKEMFIANQASTAGIHVDDQLKETLMHLDEQQIQMLINNQANQIAEAKKSALEQRSKQDVAYLQRAGVQPTNDTVDPEYDYYG